MWLSDFTVQNCRIINEVTLELNRHINFFFGVNGSGKTSVIEALSILSLGRSFRTHRISEVIQDNKDYVLVSAIGNKSTNADTRIGIKKSNKKTLIHVNRSPIKSQSHLSKLLPISIIHPLSHELISGGASMRRSYIDWIAFYLFPEFHQLWKQYSAVLKQRNAALKEPKLYFALEHLTSELSKLQKPIHKYRLAALDTLKHELLNSIPSFLSDYTPQLSLSSGLPGEVDLEADALFDYYLSRIALEKKLGRTTKGIHYTNLEIKLNAKPAATTASRGQAKIASILLYIAQSLAINKKGIIAIDDLSAELDADNYRKVLNFVLSLNRQLFITDTNKNTLPVTGIPTNTFHVEHGSIVPT